MTQLRSLSSDAGNPRALALRRLIEGPEMGFLMEAHSGLSAKVVKEAGFEAIWASGLSISASLGLRDNNEASWTQVLDVVEFIAEAAELPILLDGDTGYGNFNSMRRLVRKVEQRGGAGVCIEDKIFPKTNSFLRGTAQPLADADEFAGKIKAGKDAQLSSAFVVVARTEALIAGRGLKEALRRGELYRQAGADALLIHSAKSDGREIGEFMGEWAQRLPVVIVPTKYYKTPTDEFRKWGVGAVIWANHLMRSALAAMQATAATVRAEQHVRSIESRIAPLAEVFRIQGDSELADAEKRYLPRSQATHALLLASAERGGRGDAARCSFTNSARALGPGAIVERAKAQFYANSIIDVRVLEPTAAGVEPFGEARQRRHLLESLRTALGEAEGDVIIGTDQGIFSASLVAKLLLSAGDVVVAVETQTACADASAPRFGFAVCAGGPATALLEGVKLLDVAHHESSEVSGQWTGFLKLSRSGVVGLGAALDALLADEFATPSLPDLLRYLIAAGRSVDVVFGIGEWQDMAVTPAGVTPLGAAPADSSDARHSMVRSVGSTLTRAAVGAGELP